MAAKRRPKKTAPKGLVGATKPASKAGDGAGERPTAVVFAVDEIPYVAAMADRFALPPAVRRSPVYFYPSEHGHRVRLPPDRICTADEEKVGHAFLSWLAEDLAARAWKREVYPRQQTRAWHDVSIEVLAKAFETCGFDVVRGSEVMRLTGLDTEPAVIATVPPRRGDKLDVRMYCRKGLVSAEAFADIWAHFGAPPFSAARYDQVERMKNVYAAGAAGDGYRLFSNVNVLIRGQGALAMLSSTEHFDPVLVWSLWLGSDELNPPRLDRWLEWLARLFVLAPTLFASGCMGVEFRAKHHRSVEYAPGQWRSDDPGWRGRVFGQALPGVYWLNYYGKEITSELGQRIRDNESLVVRDLGEGRLLALLNEPPIAADAKPRVTRERAIAAQLGAEFFFDIDEPDAPKRQVPELAALLRAKT
jgi:hypothetical protein